MALGKHSKYKDSGGAILNDKFRIGCQKKADLGVVVDPDIDCLAFICEDGEMFGEGYTLVTYVDFVLGKAQDNTVSNMSSSRALRDLTNSHNGNYEASAVREVNVVELMKKNNAILLVVKEMEELFILNCIKVAIVWWE